MLAPARTLDSRIVGELTDLKDREADRIADGTSQQGLPGFSSAAPWTGISAEVAHCPGLALTHDAHDYAAAGTCGAADDAASAGHVRPVLGL